ncbi:MAG TPA: hypothetical protein VIP28_09175 [Nocardioides sp.]
MPKVTIPILADGDEETLRDLRRALAIAKRNAKTNAGVPQRGGDPAPDEEVEAAKVAHDEFLDVAAERAEGWTLETIGHHEFRELLKQHPARTVTRTNEDGTTEEVVEPEDEGFGVNTETFPRALLLFVDPDDPEIRTIAALDIDGEDIVGEIEVAQHDDQGKPTAYKHGVKVTRRVKRLSAGHFQSLWTSAMSLNELGVGDPKLDRFSPATRTSTET